MKLILIITLSLFSLFTVADKPKTFDGLCTSVGPSPQNISADAQQLLIQTQPNGCNYGTGYEGGASWISTGIYYPNAYAFQNNGPARSGYFIVRSSASDGNGNTIYKDFQVFVNQAAGPPPVTPTPTPTPADTTAPNILSLVINPSPVDTGSGPQTVTFTARITDNGTGLANAQVQMRNPAGSPYIEINFNANNRISGNAQDGTYRTMTSFQPDFTTGNYQLTVLLNDLAGNNRNLNGNNLASLGLPSVLEVRKTIAPSPTPTATATASPTITPTPQNCTYSISPSNVNIPVEGGTATITVTTQQGCGYSAETSAPFVSLAIANGGYSITVEPNTGVVRTAQITIAGQTFTVNQAGSKSRKRVRFF